MSTEKGRCEEDFLVKVPLPQHADTYTVISHGSIIQKLENELNMLGLVITDRRYQYTYNGEIAKGEVFIADERDPDLNIAFTWINSYNKQVKFGCGIGGLIVDNNTVMLGAEGSEWIRKHTGEADSEAYDIIEQLVENTHDLFTKIIAEKERMKASPIDVEKYARIMGALFFEHNLLTPTQANDVKKQWDKALKNEEPLDNLWELYKFLMHGLEKGDIKNWQKSQQKLHHMIMAEYAIATEEEQLRGYMEIVPVGDDKPLAPGQLRQTAPPSKIPATIEGQETVHITEVVEKATENYVAQKEEEDPHDVQFPANEDATPTEDEVSTVDESPFQGTSDVSGLFHSNTEEEEEVIEEEPAVEEPVEVIEEEVEEPVKEEPAQAPQDCSAVVSVAVQLGYDRADAEEFCNSGLYKDELSHSKNLKAMREWIDGGKPVVNNGDKPAGPITEEITGDPEVLAETMEEMKPKKTAPEMIKEIAREQELEKIKESQHPSTPEDAFKDPKDGFISMATNAGYSKELISFYAETHFDNNLEIAQNYEMFKEWAPKKNAPKKSTPKAEAPKAEEVVEEQDNLVSDMEAIQKEAQEDPVIEEVKGTLFDTPAEEVVEEVVEEPQATEEVIEVVEEKLEPKITAEEIVAPVEIMTPAESKSKANALEENPFSLDDEDDILDTSDLNEGLEPSEELKKVAELIEAKMTKLYGKVSPYHHEEINGYINVVIDETLERFSIPA